MVRMSPQHDGRYGRGVVLVSTLAVTTVDLARVQFATTSLYHFLFVPLTLGLAPLVAVMQTLWYRSATRPGCGSRASSGRSC
jgi:hypothetical protein